MIIAHRETWATVDHSIVDGAQVFLRFDRSGEGMAIHLTSAEAQELAAEIQRYAQPEQAT